MLTECPRQRYLCRLRRPDSGVRWGVQTAPSFHIRGCAVPSGPQRSLGELVEWASDLPIRTVSRRSRQGPWLLWGLLIFLGSVLPVTAADEVVRTPQGEDVVVKHLILPGGVTLDFFEYIDSTGKRVKHGRYKLIYRNGVMVEYVTYSHGTRHGRFIYRYENGHKQVEGEYNNGKLDGHVIRYYENGTPQVDAEYRSGELHGRFARYFPNEHLRERGMFVDGLREGEYTEYYENGKPYLVATYREGEMDGPLTLYAGSGQIAAQGRVLEERIQGDWLCFAGKAGEESETGDLADTDPGPPAQVRADCAGRPYWECSCS